MPSSNLKGSNDTRTRTGAITPVDYNLLAKGIEVNDEHSTVVESQSSNSSLGTTAIAYMAGDSEEMIKRLEDQARFDMIRNQQDSIDSLKQMLATLLKEKQKPKAKTPSKKSKGKRKEGVMSIPCEHQE